MSGRGRGISNAPAWMTRQNQLGNGDGPIGGLPPPPPDSYGRGPPPRHHYDDRRGRHDDRRGRHDDRRDWGGRDHRGGRSMHHGRDNNDRARRGNNSSSNNNNDISNSSREQLGLIVFRSYQEEQDWADNRRRKRKTRPSKFDVPPTPQQLAAEAAIPANNPAATDFAGIPAGRDFSAVPQQTRHARRLYVGHLPPMVHEQELHDFFRTAIQQALANPKDDKNDDPILSVYINHERRFCFLEFKDVGMTTACMALDGINIGGKGKVKIKRPNDYNPTMAPKVHPSGIPELDVSKLGIISSNVQDGPNKVFIGGLHYHLTEPQVLELIQAFGKVKAFHLVKNEPDAMTSKGYCFVEFADPNSTPIAVMGLNGMDMGGGKVLTARVAGQRGQAVVAPQAFPQPTAVAPAAAVVAADSGSMIIGGYDVEALVDAAMGLKPMPMAPTHLDAFGMPLTKMTAVPPPPPPPAAPAPAALPPGSSALDIANAALDAAFGPGAAAAAPPPPPPPPKPKTRILVLLNMVGKEDLESDEEYKGLMEDVGEEVKKFGKLLSMKIPRTTTGSIEASAVGKIFLEYATIQDAANAEQELAGRQFDSNVVEASYHNEQEYAAVQLR